MIHVKVDLIDPNQNFFSILIGHNFSIQFARHQNQISYFDIFHFRADTFQITFLQK